MIKRKSLKSLMVSSAVAIVLMLGSIMSASAQSFEELSVDVPFAFSARSGRILPAGRYIVRRARTAGALFIEKAEGGTGNNDQCYLLVNPEVGTTIQDRAELVFHRYGASYFLSEVWSGADNIGYRVPKSKAERRVQRNQATYNSKAGSTMPGTYSDVVIVAVSH